MDRRAFLSKVGAVKKTGRKNNKFFSGLMPYTGNWTANEVAHLLKRTMFGAKKNRY